MCEHSGVEKLQTLRQLVGDNSLSFGEVLESFDMGIEGAAVDELEDQAPVAIGIVAAEEHLGDRLGGAVGVNLHLRGDFFQIF